MEHYVQECLSFLSEAGMQPAAKMRVKKFAMVAKSMWMEWVRKSENITEEEQEARQQQERIAVGLKPPPRRRGRPSGASRRAPSAPAK